MLHLGEELKSNSYPGRGIILGRYKDEAVLAYFIMGRSENSRNRIFEEIPGGIKTKAFDEAKLEDPSLIIYNPIKSLQDYIIVSNGDQTDTIYTYMESGKSFEEALRSREFEPDAPNYTPRISGLLHIKEELSYKMSILKAADADATSCNRYFYEYENIIAGTGHFIHTYEKDGTPIPSFYGEPKKICIDKDIEEFTSLLWNSLNEDNKVSLFVQYIDLKSGTKRSKICNKNE